MRRRADLPILLLVLALGCGGKTGVGAAGGDGSASSSGGVSSSGAGGSSSGSSSGSSGSGSDGGSGGIVDAAIPDAFPVSCAQFTFVLDPDAAANTCAFTPADVACNTNADCEWYVDVGGCGCFQPVYGVNKTSTAACIPHPCPPPQCPGDASGGYLTQDCQFVDNSPYSLFIDSGTTVAVACVNHQCETYAVNVGSE